MPAYVLLSAKKDSIEGMIERTFAFAAASFARVLKLRYEGIAIDVRIPRMMTTIRSSIRVNPRSSPLTRLRKLSIMRFDSLDRGGGYRDIDPHGPRLVPQKRVRRGVNLRARRAALCRQRRRR